MTAKEYLEQLAQSAGLSQEEKDNLLKVAGNEKFSKGLEDGVMMRSDYSRNMDALQAEKKKTLDYYTDLVKTTDANQKTLNQYAAAVQAYEAQYGPLEGAGGTRRETVQPVQGDFISKKDLDERLNQLNANYITVVKAMGRVASQHAVEFKEPLDVDALEKLAVERNLPIQQAYDEWVKPRRDKLTQEQFDAKLEAARKEGAREFASTHKIPVDTQPREYHVIFDQDATKQVETKEGRLTAQGERTLRDAFVSEWEKAGAPSGTSGG